MKAGFEYAYTALEPLGNGASLPETQEIDRRAQALGMTTGLDEAAMREASKYFEWLTIRESKPRGLVAKYDKALYEHQIPGGMISNLRSQLLAMGIEHRLPEIMEEAARVRHDLGYPIVVSPFAQFIVTQSVLNVVQGERYRTIPDEVRKYACGYYGRLAAQPAPEFLERARIRPDEMVTERPGEHIDAWLPRLRKQLGAATSDEDLLLHAFYDEKLLAPLRDPTPECEQGTTPLRELVKWLHDKRDIQRARIRFAGTEISFNT
jgi:pyruvate/oxaloacetate carboxyltransferase